MPREVGHPVTTVPGDTWPSRRIELIYDLHRERCHTLVQSLESLRLGQGKGLDHRGKQELIAATEAAACYAFADDLESGTIG